MVWNTVLAIIIINVKVYDSSIFTRMRQPYQYLFMSHNRSGNICQVERVTIHILSINFLPVLCCKLHSYRCSRVCSIPSYFWNIYQNPATLHTRCLKYIFNVPVFISCFVLYHIVNISFKDCLAEIDYN
jgi:hypothetical protein